MPINPAKSQPVSEALAPLPAIRDMDSLKNEDALSLLMRELDLLRAENERLRLRLLSLVHGPETGRGATVVEFEGYPKMLIIFDENGNPKTATFLSEPAT